MFKTRFFSGAVLTLTVLAMIILGGYFTLGFIGIISLIGMYELYRVFKVERAPIAFVGYTAAVVYYVNLAFDFIPEIWIFIVALLILLLFFYVISYPKYQANQVMAVFFGVFYVAVMLSYLYRLRIMENGVFLPLLAFFCTWGCDSCAYFVGRKIGKHKMAPVLSPKKSIEGAVGGVLGAALFVGIYLLIVKYCFTKYWDLSFAQIGIMAGVSAIAGFLSMFGDLAASAIKRNYDIKDYGKLIPGHGGILDRFDSMIIVAPIVYYLVYYCMVYFFA